jgi:hypothetical protein
MAACSREVSFLLPLELLPWWELEVGEGEKIPCK